MSDFDKEAEKRKLREKFDRDREKRKETERMSQLLLQGATMTNRHCDTCGDPLFRYQEQEFCATCEGRAQETAQADAQQAQSTADETTAAGPTAQQDTAATPAGDGQTDDGETVDHAVEQADTSTPQERTTQPPTPTPSSEPAAESRRGDGDLAAAHESLIRTLTHHARRAEAVDDPRRATDHLKAVREAAEALSALEQGR